MAAQVFRIPLTNIPQEFNISLSDRFFTFKNVWNDASKTWEINIFDSETTEVLISSLPLVTNNNLLEQYEYLGIPGKLICFTDGDEFSPPTLDNLGKESNLYYIIDN